MNIIWVIVVLVAGIVIGGGVALVQRVRAQRDPDRILAQWLISRALSKALDRARKAGRVSLNSGPYVIFSDHHKGATGDADNFMACKPTYQRALDHYLAKEHTLIVMGDAEDLWEERIEDVLQTHGDILEIEARFHPERHIRIRGNHDDYWKSPRRVKRYLSSYFPNIEFRDELIFEFDGETDAVCEIFLVHGHQGTIDSDYLAFWGRRVLPMYREFQNLTGLGKTTPARHACLRAEHDSQMYRWASKQGKLLLIAGHTHRPVWSSRTHLEKLLWELYQLRRTPAKDRPADYADQVAKLRRDIKEREDKYPPCKDTIKTRPCYFNAGCCRFSDGDITGIELDASSIRLIKWGKDEDQEDGTITRTVLEEAPLSEIFFFL